MDFHFHGVFTKLVLLLYAIALREVVAVNGVNDENNNNNEGTIAAFTSNNETTTNCKSILRKSTCLKKDTCSWSKQNSTDPRCSGNKAFARRFKRKCAPFACVQLLNETNGGNTSNSANKSFYNIRFVYHPSTPDRVKPVFEAARLKWQSIITGDLGDSIRLSQGEEGCPGIGWTRVNAKEG